MHPDLSIHKLYYYTWYMYIIYCTLFQFLNALHNFPSFICHCAKSLSPFFHSFFSSSNRWSHFSRPKSPGSFINDFHSIRGPSNVSSSHPVKRLSMLSASQQPNNRKRLQTSLNQQGSTEFTFFQITSHNPAKICQNPFRLILLYIWYKLYIYIYIYCKIYKK